MNKQKNVIQESQKRHLLPYHIAALASIIIWSSTYISTKILLKTFHPIEISLFRFFISYVFLLIVRPALDFKISFKRDKYFMLAGLLGMFLYYFVENMATKYTYASNVALIVSCIPIITSILAHIINKDEKFNLKLIAAFVISLSGIVIVVVSKGEIIQLSLIGDILAFAAALIFSLYNIIVRRIDKKCHVLDIVRKSVFFGIGFIFITYLFQPEKSNLLLVFQIPGLLHLLFLGIFASGLCFVLWNKSVKEIGSIRASQYIYLVPIITGILSVIVLNESFGIVKIIGMGTIIIGVIYSQR